MKKSHLLINEPALQVLPSLATAIGLEEAIIVQQLHYWLNNEKAGEVRDGEKWIFNTYEEWQENFPFWNVQKIKRLFLNLEEMGVIISAQLDAKKHDMRKFYRLDYDKLCTMECIKSEPSNVSKVNHVNSITETTAKNTPEKPTYRDPFWDLQHGKSLELAEDDHKRIELEEAYKTIAAKLETGLRRGNFPQTTRAQVVYKWIVGKEKEGQSLDRFIQWAMRDEKAAESSWIYHDDLERIRRDWMQAFPAVVINEKQKGAFYG